MIDGDCVDCASGFHRRDCREPCECDSPNHARNEGRYVELAPNLSENHGTRYAYQQGCTCSGCRDANAIYAQRLRQR